MDYLLFLLLNATLFIRPAEIVPVLLGLPIFNILMLLCLAVNLVPISRQLSERRLRESPLTVCVLGIGVAVVLSCVAPLGLRPAVEAGVEFAKVVLYYLLLISVINSPARLRGFLFALVGFTLVLTALALLHYHEIVTIPSLDPFIDMVIDPETGESQKLPRLCSTGIYNDPNDLSQILIVGMGGCLYGFGDRRLGLFRSLWLAPFGLFLYALMLTHSRGGFVALLAGMLALLHARFGGRKALVLAVFALPLAFALFGGRQTDVASISGERSQDRIQLWVEGLAMFQRAPLFGVGQNLFAEEVGLVAHNSFVHGFAELGIFGGGLFLGAFAYALWTLFRVGRPGVTIPDPELKRILPYLTALVAAYAAGMLTLSRNYTQPTYLILGLVTVYLQIAFVRPPLTVPRLDSALVWRLAGVSVAFLVLIKVFVALTVRWSDSPG